MAYWCGVLPWKLIHSDTTRGSRLEQGRATASSDPFQTRAPRPGVPPSARSRSAPMGASSRPPATTKRRACGSSPSRHRTHSAQTPWHGGRGCLQPRRASARHREPRNGVRVGAPQQQPTRRAQTPWPGHRSYHQRAYPRSQRVAFSPDGRQLATGNLDRRARVWELRSGRQLAGFQHQGAVQAVAFSPDGHQLATATAYSVLDKTAYVWELAAAASSPAPTPGRGLGGCLQPRRAPARHRQRRQDGVRVGVPRRAATRRAPTPGRGLGGCLQPRRAPARHRQRRQDGVRVGVPGGRSSPSSNTRAGSGGLPSAPTGASSPPPASKRHACGDPKGDSAASGSGTKSPATAA